MTRIEMENNAAIKSIAKSLEELNQTLCKLTDLFGQGDAKIRNI